MASTGGWSLVKQARNPNRNRQTKEEKEDNALKRSENKLGIQVVKDLQEELKKCDDEEERDGMILSLLTQGLSQSEVRAVYHIGGSRAQRIYSLIGQENRPERESQSMHVCLRINSM